MGSSEYLPNTLGTAICDRQEDGPDRDQRGDRDRIRLASDSYFLSKSASPLPKEPDAA